MRVALVDLGQGSAFLRLGDKLVQVDYVRSIDLDAGEDVGENRVVVRLVDEESPLELFGRDADDLRLFLGTREFTSHDDEVDDGDGEEEVSDR